MARTHRTTPYDTADTSTDAPATTDASTDAPDDDASTDAPTTDTADTSTDAPATDAPAAAAFRAAWSAAIAERDTSTGTVDAVHIDAVKRAFHALPRGDARARAVLEASSATSADAIASGGDVSMMQAGAHVADALHNATAGRERVTRDPLDVAAERVALLDVARAMVLADVDASTVTERASAIVAGAPSDALTTRLARIVRALGGSGGTRAAGIDVNAHVLAVLADASDPMTYGAIAAASSDVAPNGAASGGAVQNALARLADAGTVVIVERTDAGNPRTARLA